MNLNRRMHINRSWNAFRVKANLRSYIRRLMNLDRQISIDALERFQEVEIWDVRSSI
jgi:hypothetical protein